MRHVHRPAYTVPASDIYWCTGMLHKHKTEHAARECEARPMAVAYGRYGQRRINNGDGTYSISGLYGTVVVKRDEDKQ